MLLRCTNSLARVVLALALGASSCTNSETAKPLSSPAPSSGGRTGEALVAPTLPPTSPSAPSAPAAAPASAPAAAPVSPPAPEPRYGYADLDPTNDRVVAPPEAVPDCEARLRSLGAEFLLSEIPLRNRVQDIPTCGAHDAVILKKLPTGITLRPPALLTCSMALGLAHFTPRLQELADEQLGAQVKTIQHVGTYNCRKMVRFDLVSEHSYGNAIDVGELTLTDGRRVNVKKDFGKLDEEPRTDTSRFLRKLGNVAFDEDYFSVSLGPYWDALHRDHFHFDQARYRVDGSRP